MSSLTFAIPTYNRVKQVEIAIRSIAAQIGPHDDVGIVVSDHGSNDGTGARLLALQQEFPYLQRAYLARTETSDFQDNFQYCFSLPVMDWAKGREWTWTFGDDDILLPGALQAVLGVLSRTTVQFIHVAEAVRTATNSYVRGTLLQLCNDLGWLDMTGFITCNIVRTERLRRAVNHPSWSKWAECAFPQSLALLAELAHDPALFIDSPMVDSQAHEQSPETLKRWEANQTAKRYFFVDNGLSDLVSRGEIPPTLDNAFFRYHSYFLWDRLIGNMITQNIHHPEDPQDELWAHILGIADFLNADDAQIVRDRVSEVRLHLARQRDAVNHALQMTNVLQQLYEQHQVERFPFTYLAKHAKDAGVVDNPTGVSNEASTTR